MYDMTFLPEMLITGNQLVDRQHARIFEIAEEFEQSVQAGEEGVQIEKVMQSLYDYVDIHFGEEEELMHSIAYPELNAHQSKHAALVRRLHERSQEFLEGDSDVQRKLVDVVRDWIAHHILIEDVKVIDWMKSHQPKSGTAEI